jgi:hypothetical protein
MRKAIILGLMMVGMLLLVQGVAGQPPDTLWTRTYGGGNNDYCYSVQQTIDGGYVMAGWTYSSGAGGADVYLIKTNSLGNAVWTQTYGGSSSDYGYSVRQTSDGGYIIVGETSSYGAGSGDVYLIKTNAMGSQVWMHTYGGIYNDYGYSVEQTSDSGYIVVGYTFSFGSGGSDIFLIKTDANGNPLWNNTFGGNNDEQAFSVQPISSGGYIIAGDTRSSGAGAYDVYLIKTDSIGNSVWSHTYGGNQDDYGWSVQQTADGGYVITGTTFSYGAGASDVYLLKTDAVGNQIWQHSFGWGNSEEGFSVQQTSDSGYVIAGYSGYLSINTSDVYLIKTDTAGNLVWQSLFGGTDGDIGRSVQQTSDNGYVVAGYTLSYGAGSYDAYLIKTEAEGPPQLDVTLTPINPPIIIPANGGSFNFNASVQRTVGPQTPFSVWARIKYPNGTYTNPTLGPVTINPPVGTTITRLRNQSIPGSWPSGLYTYLAYANTTFTYPAIDSSSFPFTKSTTGDGGVTVWEATCSGELFPGEQPMAASPPSGLQLNVGPNPFNPTTAISYELRAASFVTLNVYDTAGRVVSALVDGWREEGTHNVTFDGSNLAAGVLLVRLEAGNQVNVEKIILLK